MEKILRQTAPDISADAIAAVNAELGRLPTPAPRARPGGPETLRSSVLAPFVLVLAGCATQSDVRKPFQEELQATGRIMGFALAARQDALETKLAVVEADPKLEAKLGTAAEIRKEIERVHAEKLSLEAELKALKDRYPLEDEGN